MVTLVTFVPAVVGGNVEFPISKVALGLTNAGFIEKTVTPVPVSSEIDPNNSAEVIEFDSVPYNLPVVGKVTDVAAVDVNVVGNAPAVVKLPPKVTVLPVLSTPVPPLAPGNIPITPEVRGNPVALDKTTALGVPRFGVTKVGLVANTASPVPVSSEIDSNNSAEVIELDLVPYNVPVVGRVTDVAAVDVKVVGNAPAVVKLPPKVTVLPVLATPVPPLAPGNIPITPVARGNPVAPVKTAVEAAGPTGP
jgi:hypothetical protein